MHVARTAMGLAAPSNAVEGAGAAPHGLTPDGAREVPDVPMGPTVVALGVDDGFSALTGRRREAGYYLVSDGRHLLEEALRCHVPRTERLRRALVRRATPGYLGTLGLSTAMVLALPLWYSAVGGTPIALLLLMAIAALIPASDVAVAVVNWLVTHLLGPRSLPRLELEGGVPPDLRTLVVIPTLLADDAHTEALVGLLEVHFLSNPDGDLRFALLTDWLDAPSERAAGDEALLATAVAGIDRLNARHGEAPGGGARFLLFHRERRWNAAQGVWMGWERKRGKLHELNALLRGSSSTSILLTGRGSSIPPAGVRYVITLDSDTRLPRGAAARLVGTMAHPLNRPVFDPRAGRVVDGHAILQPRVTTTLPDEREASIFQRVYSGSAGIDPYASAVSDVYQDLFGEGTYTGKGIYDVDVFERALAGRAPENTLLSHDLIEGTFARAGLVTDIELFDESPSRYEEAAARQHRWARGDWQLLPWILGRAHSATGRPSEIPSIARWKMIDNLRRTLFAPFALLTLLAAWTLPSAQAGVWTGLHPGHDARARVAARARRTAAAATGDLEAQSPPGGGHRPGACRSPCGTRHRVPRRPGRADAGCRPAHARPGLRHAPGPAPVDDGGARQVPCRARHPGVLSSDGRWRRHRRRVRSPRPRPEAVCRRLRSAVRRPLDRSPRWWPDGSA